MDSGMHWHWVYSDEEWARHLDWQYRKGIRGARRSALLFGILAAVGGVLAASPVTFVVLLIMMGWIPVTEWQSARSSRVRQCGQPAETVIAPGWLEYTDFVLGRRQISLEGRKILKSAIVNEPGGPSYLHITHKGKRRRASSWEEKILIPAGREDEAKQAADLFPADPGRR